MLEALRTFSHHFLASTETGRGIRNLTGNDLFFPLILDQRAGDLHRFIRRVLLGEVKR
jgi:hypothetical protein